MFLGRNGAGRGGRGFDTLPNGQVLESFPYAPHIICCQTRVRHRHATKIFCKLLSTRMTSLPTPTPRTPRVYLEEVKPCTGRQPDMAGVEAPQLPPKCIGRALRWQ